MEFPFGPCECEGGLIAGGFGRPGCCGGEGPAAYEVTRNDVKLKLCTRCDLTSDRPTRVLLLTEETQSAPFEEHDPLGFMCLCLDLLAARNARKGS